MVVRQRFAPRLRRTLVSATTSVGTYDETLVRTRASQGSTAPSPLLVV